MAMLKKILLLLAAAGVCGSAVGTGLGVQIREGVYKEEVEGDLEGAIKIYENIVKEHSENHEYAAQAEYRLGLCYLKKGEKQKAIEQFDRITAGYPGEKTTVSKAKKQLSKLRPPAKIPSFFDNQVFIFQIAPVIGELHFQFRAEAKEKGLHYNNHFYGIDKTFTCYSGGLTTLENNTSSPLTGDIHLMNAGGGDIHFFNEQGFPVNVNVKERAFVSAPKYQYTWNPKVPVQPGKSRTLFWGFGVNKMRQVGDNRYATQMNNHFGDKVLECFLLIMPSELEIFKSSRDYSFKKNAAGYTIYVYKREVPENTNNKVDITVGRRQEDFSESGELQFNRPTVIESVPANYTDNVSADLKELSVTFDQKMKDGCWAWVQRNYNYPETTGSAGYDPALKTCSIPVKLKPGTAYMVGINSKTYQSFMSQDGISAQPFVLVFATKDENGNPTPIPDDMLSFAEKINSIKQQRPYTQKMTADISADGTLHFKINVTFNNSGSTPVNTTSFINSDFVKVTAMHDDIDRPLKFTSKHEGNIYRYHVTFNEPVMPGETLEYSHQGIMTGLVKPLTDFEDTFWYHMEHSPSTNKTTLRLETFLLPEGAELISTNPAGIKQSRKDGRIELQHKKIIPAGNSIVTQFQYRLAGGSTDSLKLIDAPWVDREKMMLDLNTMAGMKIGEITYLAEAAEKDDKKLWQIESYMNISANNMQQYTRVDAEIDSFAPVYGRTKNWMGDFTGSYTDNKVTLKSDINGKKTEKIIDIKMPVFDNEQAIYLIRRMPLAEGYSGEFDIFPVQSGAVIKCRIIVKGKEKITVKAGTFDCYIVDLACYAGNIKVLQHDLWFSADNNHYLVRYDSRQAVMELKEIGLKNSKPEAVKDDQLHYCFEIPAGWMESAGTSGQYKVSKQLIAPKMEGWAVFNGSEIGADRNIRRIAELDAEALKGFFKNYLIRGDSWNESAVNGLKSEGYTADYEDKGKAMVEYRAYIKSSPLVYRFVFRIEKEKFDQIRAVYDSIIESFKIDLKAVKETKSKAKDICAEGRKLLFEQNKFIESERKFKEAAKLDPLNDEAWQGLGWSQFNLRKKENAKDSFEKCININPKNPAALNGLGWIDHADGSKSKAVQWWEKAVKNNPDTTASLNGLTQVYMEREDYDKAIIYYEMWLKAEPDNQDVKEGLKKAKEAGSTK